MNTNKRLSVELMSSVSERTGLARTTIYQLVKKKRFPQQVRISDKRVGWISSEVDEWINQRIEESRGVSAQ